MASKEDTGVTMLMGTYIETNTISFVLFLLRIIHMFQQLTCNQLLGIVKFSLVSVNLV